VDRVEERAPVTREIRYDSRPSLRFALQRRPLTLLVRRFAPLPAVTADVGSANGALGELLVRTGLAASYTGFEIDEGLRAQGARLVDVRPFDAERDHLSGSYDLIICSHLIEHVRDPDAVIGRLVGALRDGGVIIVVTPNTSSWSARVRGRAWIGYADPTHISLRSHSAWLETLERAGLEVLYHGSSYVSDAPIWGFPAIAVSKLLLVTFGYARWTRGNSSAFVAAHAR
jgi:SAM-dependent methyltransferase